MPLARLEGAPFEDVLDGYFELRDAAAQMLERRGLASAVIELRHAPFMLLDLPRAASVPLRLGMAPSGVLVRAVLTHRGARMGGAALWRLEGARPDALPVSIRLSEPAAIRGIGFGAGPVEAGPLGLVAGPGPAALLAPGAGAAGAWPVHAPGPIRPEGAAPAALLRA